MTIEERLKCFTLRLIGNSTGARTLELKSRNRRLKTQLAKLQTVTTLDDENKKLQEQIETLKTKLEQE